MAPDEKYEKLPPPVPEIPKRSATEANSQKNIIKNNLQSKKIETFLAVVVVVVIGWRRNKVIHWQMKQTIPEEKAQKVANAPGGKCANDDRRGDGVRCSAGEVCARDAGGVRDACDPTRRRWWPTWPSICRRKRIASTACGGKNLPNCCRGSRVASHAGHH